MAAERTSAPLTGSQEAWLLVSAVLTLAPAFPSLPPWLTVTAALALLWRALLGWRRAGLPPRWLLGLFVLAGSAAVWLTYRQLFGKDPGIALLALFLALKPLEMRRVRDGLAVLFLCLFLLLTHFLNEQGMAMAGYVLVTVAVVTTSLTNLAHPARPLPDQLRLSLLLLAQAAPFMLVLFLFFPRVQGPLWGMPADAHSGLSGLSDSMSPGSISNLILSGEIAFRVRFEGEIPPPQQLYWRGPVLRHFDGRSWRAAPPQEKVSAGSTATAAGLDYVVTLEPHNRPWLFALDLPLTAPANAFITREFQVLSKVPVRSRLRYAMRSAPLAVAGGEEPPAVLQANLTLPAGNPRTRALAERWRREAEGNGGQAAVVERMLAHLRREPFFYTLTPPLLGENGIDQFLFETRRGFCEHYAAAFVFAMRAAGIPARVVTGYQGGERNPVDGYLVVRQSDAHAWAEVWLAGRGWVRVDPTAAVAPSRIEAGLASAVPAGEPLPFQVRPGLSWLRQLRYRWEAVGNAWNQWVLGYDPQRQRELLLRIGLRQPDWRTMTAAMSVLCGVLLFGLTAWALGRRVRTDAVQRDWNRLSRKLGRIGLARHLWEGPQDYLRRVARARPELETQLGVIASLYSDLRYGRLDDREARRRLRRLIATLRIGRRNRWQAIVPLAALCLLLPPSAAAGYFEQREEVRAFVAEMQARHGFEPAALLRLFSRLRPQPAALRAIRPPSDPSRRSWRAYRLRFLDPARIGGGLHFWAENRPSLEAARQTYGVPEAIIVAILGIETLYGRHLGSFPALATLATLAFDYPPRAALFRGELEALLLLARETGRSPLAYSGSYAGALGMPQFLPSSIRRWGVDFDGDGRVDLAASRADAIGSVAHFLAAHGWERDGPVAVPVQASGERLAELIGEGLLPRRTPAEMADHGVVAPAAVPQQPCALIDLPSPGEDTEYWLGYRNFYVLTRYNRSSFYAMAVFALAQALQQARRPAETVAD